MVLTTTLNRLHAANACAERYQHLLKALGGPSVNHDAPINLLTILDSNGVDDCLWALQATEQNCDVVARLMACDFAEAVLQNFEKQYPKDQRPRAAIEAARKFARGEITAEELAAASAAASRCPSSSTAMSAVRAASWASSPRHSWASCTSSDRQRVAGGAGRT